MGRGKGMRMRKGEDGMRDEKMEGSNFFITKLREDEEDMRGMEARR